MREPVWQDWRPPHLGWSVRGRENLPGGLDQGEEKEWGASRPELASQVRMGKQFDWQVGKRGTGTGVIPGMAARLMEQEQQSLCHRTTV